MTSQLLKLIWSETLSQLGLPPLDEVKINKDGIQYILLMRKPSLINFVGILLATLEEREIAQNLLRQFNRIIIL